MQHTAAGAWAWSTNHCAAWPMTGTVTVWSSASSLGRRNGTVAPWRWATSAISSSSVLTTTCSNRPDSRAAAMA